jgi:hypothetical protein
VTSINIFFLWVSCLRYFIVTLQKWLIQILPNSFQSDDTNMYSHQQCILFLKTVTNSRIRHFHFSNSHWYVVVFFCGFNLHFPINKWDWLWTLENTVAKKD